MTSRDRTPNWNKWRLIPNLEQWKCVALSLNIDPDKVRCDQWVFYESQEFKDRLYITCANLGRRLIKLASYGRNRDGGREVSLRQFASWVKQTGWQAPPELLALADEEAAAANAATASRDELETDATPPAAAFNDMDGLTWNEITITFTETEAVRVRARGKKETFTFDAMGFKHRTSHMAKPNECWETFRCLAIVNTSDKTWNDVTCTDNLKKRISRLRRQLKRFFGIAGNPIAFRESVGYQPAFNLTIEEHVILNMRERYADCADEDEGDNIQRLMSETPGGWSR